MARRRRKHRTHVRKGQNNNLGDKDHPNVPRSFIIKHGNVGTSLASLVRDMRKVMEPNTATRLKEQSRNKLKDYLVMGPSLHVSHILAFTLTSISPTLRIIRLPAGPTLTFRIERYSLVKDILHVTKRARGVGLEYLAPPLLVCASFPPAGPTTPRELPLLLKTFQSLFPSLSPAELNLPSARRVVLLSYNAETQNVDFRHYLITVKPYGISKRIRKVLDGSKRSGSHVLDLGNEQDIADFFLRQKGEPSPGGAEDDGYESAASSASSAGGDDPDAALELPADYVGRNNRKGERRAVKLDEIGPRMEISLLKISEGLPGKEGSVIYHRFVQRTSKEIAQQKAEHSARAQLKQQRREEQERNIAAKQKKVGVPGNTEAEESFEDGTDAEDDDGGWRDEESVEESSDGRDDDDDEEEEEEEEEAPPPPPPKKKRKIGR